MVRRIEFVSGEIYHIYSRSTEGILLFRNDADRKRILRTMHTSNTHGYTPRELARLSGKDKRKNPTKKLVEVYFIILRPNHFHICVKQLVDGGISLWMQRALNSYAHYFNLKYNRKGTLFMSRFQAKHITSDIQLSHLFVYIHANALDSKMPQWREGKIESWLKARDILEKYPWSSYSLYTSGKAIKEIVQLVDVDSFRSQFDMPNLEEAIRDWSGILDVPGTSW